MLHFGECVFVLLNNGTQNRNPNRKFVDSECLLKALTVTAFRQLFDFNWIYQRVGDRKRKGVRERDRECCVEPEMTIETKQNAPHCFACSSLHLVNIHECTHQ